MDVERRPLSWNVINAHYDNHGFKYGFGNQVWKSNEGVQTFSGNFLLDFYHTYGQYKWSGTVNTLVYEGPFFANYKEGYGRMSYANGNTFEGLYRNDHRFGPGVFTYSDGTQDVGFWIGSQMVRLVTLHSDIPKLATSDLGKIKVLQFRAIVSLPERDEDIASSVLADLGGPNKANIRKKLYSEHVRNPRSLFFNKPLFNNYFFQDFHRLENFCMNELQMNDGNEAKEIKWELQNSANILTWNNEEYAIDILKHCFKYLSFEELVTFKIEELFKGNRSHFYPRGGIEVSNIKLLLRSARSDWRRVLHYICYHDLCPDVRDCLGNSPVMIAAASDHLEVISELAKLSANLNSINDEGLTPLGLCLLRYLAILYSIKNWEIAFLPPLTYELKVKEWRGGDASAPESKDSSLLSDISNDGGEVRSTEKIKKQNFPRNEDLNGSDQKYLFRFNVSTNLADYEAEKDKPSNKIFQSMVQWQHVKSTNEESTLGERTLKLSKIKATICTLLESGAEVRNIIQVPRSFLLMGLFCHNRYIVEGLLIAGSDPNEPMTHEEGELTPLHVTCLLPPNEDNTAAVELLLLYKANPNSSASPEWYKKLSTEWKIEFISQDPRHAEITTITPLQLLMLRPDLLFNEGRQFFCETASLLAPETKPDILFLGHTPLSTAIVRRNPDLINCLLSSGVDPNIELAADLGTSLAVLLHKDNFNTEISEQMFELLLENGIDVLQSILIDGINKNIIDFANHQVEMLLASIVEEKPQKGKSKKKEETPEKELLLMKIEAYENCVKRLKHVIREAIMRHIKGKLTRVIIQKAMAIFDKIPFSSEEGVMKAQNYLTDVDFFNYLNIHMDHGAKMYKEDMYTCFNILSMGTDDENIKKIINSNNFLNKLQKKRRPRLFSVTGREKFDLYHIIFDKPSFLEKCQKNSVKYPELDRNTEKYKLCFNCFRSNTECIECPTCHLTFFCSDGCQNNLFDSPDDENTMLCGICGKINEEAIQCRSPEDEHGAKALLSALKEKVNKMKTDKKKGKITSTAKEGKGKGKPRTADSERKKKQEKTDKKKEGKSKKQKSESAATGDREKAKKGEKDEDGRDNKKGKTKEGKQKKDKDGRDNKKEKTKEGKQKKDKDGRDNKKEKTKEGKQKKDKDGRESRKEKTKEAKEKNEGKKGGKESSQGEKKRTAEKGEKESTKREKSKGRTDTPKKGEKELAKSKKGEKINQSGKTTDREVKGEKGLKGKESKAPQKSGYKTTTKPEVDIGKKTDKEKQTSEDERERGGTKTEGYISKVQKPLLAGKEFAEALLKSLLEKAGLSLGFMLPYVVLRDGFLFYKLYGNEPDTKENYSLN